MTQDVDSVEDVEITPEMIEAGAAVLYGFETLTADEAYWAKEVYVAMRRAALLSQTLGRLAGRWPSG